MSTAYSRIVGRTDLIGKTYAEAFPELAETELPGILQRVYATGQRYVSPETLVRLAVAGTTTLKDHHFEFSLEPMRDAAGRVQGLLAVATDVTAQVQARQFLERSSDERQALLVAAESASRAKDEFLALLGHELRNPLSPIVTALQVLKSRPHEGSQREFDIISRQVTHLTRLVDDLLDISTITRGKVQLRRTRSSVADIVARSVEMASHAIEQRRHTLDVAQPEAGLAWVGDAARLVQVVSNLLTNAARYSPEGTRIELNVAAMADAQLVISVRDEGNGIAADVLPQVFGMFFQGQHNIDRAEGGLGLGLALVKNLVEMHGGTVSDESAGLGRGSTFTVRLPLHGAEPDAASALLPLPLPVEALAAGRRVMVVDDNHDAADTLAELLRLFGHTVAVAREPLAALELAEQFDPDVAILDIGLPGIDGYELAERLRRQAGGNGRRLIALTGYGQAGDRSRSRAAGFDLHLVKPVDFDALHAALMADAAPR